MKKQCKRNENSIISTESVMQQSRSMPEEQGKKAQRSIADEESVALSFSAAANQLFGSNKAEEEIGGKIDPQKKYSDEFYERYLCDFQQNLKKKARIPFCKTNVRFFCFADCSGGFISVVSSFRNNTLPMFCYSKHA